MIKEYINKILEKEYIRPSISLYAISILIVKKLNKELQIYINYRALNALIIKNQNILSLIRETIVRLYATRIFIKFNIITTFNEIRMKTEKKEKTTFLTRYKLFKYIIISFKLYNASSIFQIFINKILREYLDIFYFAYLNNILIYSNSKEEYIKYIKKVLEKLKKASLYLDINKY